MEINKSNQSEKLKRIHYCLLKFVNTFRTQYAVALHHHPKSLF